jgi:HPt (histidine-containing phosphotransfer) domain-containing protein
MRRVEGRFAKGSKKLLTIERTEAPRSRSRQRGFTRLSDYERKIPPGTKKTKARAGEDVMTKHGRAADDVLDEHHLRRMTLGDQSLEREVLQVFARQITLMLTRITRAEPAHAAAAAHTLKGSARGLGAWRVAEAAEQLEQAATGLGDLSEAIAELEIASNEVRGAIETRLQGAATERLALYRHASFHPA